jgi:hypothetical protein
MRPEDNWEVVLATVQELHILRREHREVDLVEEIVTTFNYEVRTG